MPETSPPDPLYVAARRVLAKDALDILRLLRGSDLDAMASLLARARSAELPASDAAVSAAIATIVTQALVVLGTEFARETARGCALAGRAAVGRDDPAAVAASLAALVHRLLGMMQEPTRPSQ
jgi:hypothetical protein